MSVAMSNSNYFDESGKQMLLINGRKSSLDPSTTPKLAKITSTSSKDVNGSVDYHQLNTPTMQKN